MRALWFYAGGIAFGLLLSRSGAADYNMIQAMFLFTDFQLYGIIGTAVAITMPVLYLLKRHGKSAFGQSLRVSTKPLNGGTVVGSLLFGVGWSITGMCPGPILVNIGEGKLYALAALGGALLGAYLVGLSYPRLSRPLRLSPLPEEPR